jgi:hypothetical protein
MMDIAFKPPVMLLVVFLAIITVAVLAVLLKKMPRWRKIAGLAISVAVCVTLLLVLYRTKHLVADDQGIHTDTYGRQSIAWTAVTSARLVPDLASSPWALQARVGGTAIGEFRSGWFRLANGTTAFVTVEASGRAVVIEGDGKTFIFAPRELDAFAAAIEKHVALTRE